MDVTRSSVDAPMIPFVPRNYRETSDIQLSEVPATIGMGLRIEDEGEGLHQRQSRAAMGYAHDGVSSMGLRRDSPRVTNLRFALANPQTLAPRPNVMSECGTFRRRTRVLFRYPWITEVVRKKIPAKRWEKYMGTG